MRTTARTLGAVLAVGAAGLASLPAHAANDAMLDLLKVLRDNGTINQEAYELLVNSAKADDEANTAGQAEIQAAGSNLPMVETKGGLKVESQDGDFSIQLGGRIMLDGAVYDDDENAAGNTVDLGDGTQVRRARIDLRGKLFRHWGYRLQHDFTEDGSAGIKDAYITFDRFKPWYVQMGQFYEPFGLEIQTSSKYITFMERSMPTNIFSPDRHLGIAVGTGGAFAEGSFGARNPSWQAKAGIFGERVQDDVPGEGDESFDITARVTAAPIYDAKRLLHLGASFRRHTPNDSSNFTRFRDRPESRITELRLVDTGDLHTGAELVDHYQSYGLEAAGYWGPVSVQGEWYLSDVERDGGASDPTFSGWYAYVSWFLTGESRGYKAEDGVFDRVRPLAPVGRGGWGAWELGLRYSSVDLSDEYIIGGEQENLTLGLNWYPNDYLRFMANYIAVLEVDRPGTTTDAVEPGILQVRAQVEW